MDNIAAMDATPADKYQCAQCEQCFPQSQLLEGHGKETKHKAYRCHIEGCSASFHLRPALSRHNTEQHLPPSHECPMCGEMFSRRKYAKDHEAKCTGMASLENVVSSVSEIDEEASGHETGTMPNRPEQARKRPISQLSTSREDHSDLDKRVRHISITLCQESTDVHDSFSLHYEMDEHDIPAIWTSLQTAYQAPNDERSTVEGTTRESSHKTNRSRHSIHSVAKQVEGLRFVMDFAQIISVPTPGERCCLCGLKQSKDLSIFFQHVVYHFQSEPMPDLECKQCSITFMFLEDFQKHSQYRNSRDGISECERMLYSGDRESDWVQDAFRTDFVQSLRAWERLKLYWLYDSMNDLVQARLQSDTKSLRTLPDRFSKATLPHRRFSSQSCVSDIGRAAANIDMMQLTQKLATISLRPVEKPSLGSYAALHKMHILVVGNRGGCTQLVLRFVCGMFCFQWEPKFADTFWKETKIGDMPVHFDVTNLNGMEEYTQFFLDGMETLHGVLVCFRVDSACSVREALRLHQLVRKWLEQEQKHEVDCPIMFVANCCDLEWEDETISLWNEASSGQLEGVPLFQVSARDQINVEKPFIALAEAILEQRRMNHISSTTKHRFDSSHDRKRRSRLLGTMWRNLISRVDE